jgi:hypothetical protein
MEGRRMYPGTDDVNISLNTNTDQSCVAKTELDLASEFKEEFLKILIAGIKAGG